MEARLLEARGLRKSYPAGGARLQALRGLDLSIDEGEPVGLVGESGCGKSTLARCLVGLEHADAGSVQLRGKDLRNLPRRHIARELQLVFQDPLAALDPRMRVDRILAEPLVIQGQLSRGERRQRVTELLSQVGLPESAASRYPHELSGGQRQRVGLARALAAGPRLLLADEPVSSLDLPVQAQIVNLLAELQRRHGLALLLISHDLRLVLHLCRRVLVMYLGTIVEEGASAELARGARHPYTQALLQAIPSLEPAEALAERRLLQGEPPSPLRPPSGCAFHPRCPLHAARRSPACTEKAPPLREFGSIRAACHELW